MYKAGGSVNILSVGIHVSVGENKLCEMERNGKLISCRYRLRDNLIQKFNFKYIKHERVFSDNSFLFSPLMYEFLHKFSLILLITSILYFTCNSNPSKNNFICFQKLQSLPTYKCIHFVFENISVLCGPLILFSPAKFSQ